VQKCIFCGCVAGIELWALDAVDHPVPACLGCAEDHGLSVTRGEYDAAGLPEYRSCRCCGRELASPGEWPMTVWVADRGRLMAVCNACRVEFALRAVFASAPPALWRARHDPGPPRGEPDSPPPR
jgi:hypothetical protein